MASEVPRLARQLFLRGLAAAFLAAFASLYVQLPGEPAAAAKGRAGRGALCTCPGAPSPFPAAAPKAKAKSSQGRPGKAASRGKVGGGCVSLSELAEGPAPKVRGLWALSPSRGCPASRSGEGTAFSAWLPRGLLALRGRLGVPLQPSTCPGRGRAWAVAPSLSSALAWEGGVLVAGRGGERGSWVDLEGREGLRTSARGAAPSSKESRVLTCPPDSCLGPRFPGGREGQASSSPYLLAPLPSKPWLEPSFGWVGSILCGGLSPSPFTVCWWPTPFGVGGA